MSEVPPVVLRPPAVGHRPFAVERTPPPAALVAVVDHFWAVTWQLPPGGRHRQEVVSHARAHVTVEDGRVWVQGVVTGRFSRELMGSGRVVGVQLRPAGIGALTDVPPATLTDRRLPGERVLGETADLADAVSAAPDAAAGMAAFAAWLAARDPRPPEGAALVDAAVDLAAARPDLTRVHELAAELAVTVRTLERRFDRHLGAGPKWLLRRCRIQDALATIEAGGSVDWADLAVRLGYADQSHFVNSFTALVGVPPGEYTRRPPMD